MGRFYHCYCHCFLQQNSHYVSVSVQMPQKRSRGYLAFSSGIEVLVFAVSGIEVLVFAVLQGLAWRPERVPLSVKKEDA
jgi:hypothetical protein